VSGEPLTSERSTKRPAVAVPSGEILGISHLVFSVRDVAEAEHWLGANGYVEHGSNASCPNHPAKSPFIAGPMAEFAKMKLMVAPNGSPAIEMTCEPAAEQPTTFYEAVLSENPLCGGDTVRTSLRDDAPAGLDGFRCTGSSSRVGGVGALVLHCRSTLETLPLWHALGVSEEILDGGLVRIRVRGFRSNNQLHIYLISDRTDMAVANLNDGGIVCLSFFCRDADRLRAALAEAGYDVGDCFTLSPFGSPLRIFFMRNTSGEVYEFLSVAARAPSGEVRC